MRNTKTYQQPIEPTDRKTVYEAIDTERNYQESLRNSERFDATCLSPGEELICVLDYVNQGLTAYSRGKGQLGEGSRNGLKEGENTQDIFRKVAAMCVRAMENHGAPKRNE